MKDVGPMHVIAIALTAMVGLGVATVCADAHQSGKGGVGNTEDAKGIWKSAIPRAPMKGKFDSHDPVGLMNGQLIKADCSINWVNPDTDELYCFTTPTSMAYFLYWPKRNTEQARRYWSGYAVSN